MPQSTSITYDSPSFGKLNFTFESIDSAWPNHPHAAALEAARGEPVKGKFCIFNVGVIEGVSVCTNRVSVAKYLEMKERLRAEVSAGIEKFEPHCAAARILREIPGTNPLAYAWMNSGQNKLSEIRAMMNYWTYDENIWPV